jgi:hypothetical protein
VLNCDPVLSTCPEDGGDTFLRNVEKTGTTRCYTPEEDFLHSNRRENLKSYKVKILILGNPIMK